jgi:hypothetical protein
MDLAAPTMRLRNTVDCSFRAYRSTELHYKSSARYFYKIAHCKVVKKAFMTFSSFIGNNSQIKFYKFKVYNVMT